MDRVCESCAAEDEDLVPVRPGGTQGQGDDEAASGGSVELWCPRCRERYPHLVADPDAEA